MLIHLIGRILFGGYFLMQAYYHFKNVDAYTGYAASKGVKYPKYAVLGTGALLAIGGLTIIAGSFIPVGVLALTIFFLGVTPKMHDYWNMTDPNQRMAERVNFYKNLALLGGAILLLTVENWPMSLF